MSSTKARRSRARYPRGTAATAAASIVEDVAFVLPQRCGLNRQAAVIVGVSGGPDSVCLMDLLHRLGYRIVVAHFNHKLRPGADSEAHVVAEAAAALAVPFLEGNADVRQEALRERISVEEAGRRLRYAFLFRQAREQRAQAVAVAHTADDQIETMLMHLIRGSGLEGLRGMRYRTVVRVFDPEIPIVRPLLGTWRSEIIAYCADHSLGSMHDPSNDSLEYFRNRIRHELIPALEAYNPRIRSTLLRTAESLAIDHGLLTEYLNSHWQRTVVRQTGDSVAFDAARLGKISEAVQRHLLRRAIRDLAPKQESTYSLLNRAVAFVADARHVREELMAGILLYRERGTVYVCRGEHVLPTDAWPQMPSVEDSIPFTVPARIALGAGWWFESKRVAMESPCDPAIADKADLFQVLLDANSLPQRLQLRSRRRGDRFQPLGLKGHSQKLSDFFVNAKLPARARGRWPLLCAGDLIVWVPGFRPADQFRMRESTRESVRFSVIRSE